MSQPTADPDLAKPPVSPGHHFAIHEMGDGGGWLQGEFATEAVCVGDEEFAYAHVEGKLVRVNLQTYDIEWPKPAD